MLTKKKMLDLLTQGRLEIWLAAIAGADEIGQDRAVLRRIADQPDARGLSEGKSK